MSLKTLSSWLVIFGSAFLLSLVVGVFLIQPYKVDGHSMDPTLHDQQRIYVSKLSHTFTYAPNYGDIVVIDSRVDRKRVLTDPVKEFPLLQLFIGSKDRIFFVKRVIGRPGDIIEVKDHHVYRNGEALEEPYIKEQMNDAADRKWKVMDDQIFVMGDNRNNSEDSRMLGCIPLDHVMGIKVL